MLTVSGLTFSYNRKPLLEALSFQAAPGECVVLAGPNGSGKSTALSLLAGVLKPEIIHSLMTARLPTITKYR